MARLSDDRFADLSAQANRDRARALGQVRLANGQHRNDEIDTWLQAGDNLAEKAIAALDLGDEARALRFVERLVAMPVIDEDTRPGLMAVDLLLRSEVDPALLEGRSDEPFARVPEASLPQAILAVLELVLRFRSEAVRPASPRLPA